MEAVLLGELEARVPLRFGRSWLGWAAPDLACADGHIGLPTLVHTSHMTRHGHRVAPVSMDVRRPWTSRSVLRVLGALRIIGIRVNTNPYRAKGDATEASRADTPEDATATGPPRA